MTDKILSPPVIPEWELWACAHAMVKRHGERAVEEAGKRIEELERDRDVDGVRAWRLIAARVDRLLAPETQIQ
jgi:hypothetical protein